MGLSFLCDFNKDELEMVMKRGKKTRREWMTMIATRMTRSRFVIRERERERGRQTGDSE